MSSLTFERYGRLGALAFALAYIRYRASQRRPRNLVTPAASADASTMEHVGAATAPSEEVAST
jgi:hypothetical protein